MNAKLSVICTEQSNGSFFAMCPDLKGCFTQGDTYEQAIFNIKDLAASIIEDGIDPFELDFLVGSQSKVYSEIEIPIKAV